MLRSPQADSVGCKLPPLNVILVIKPQAVARARDNFGLVIGNVSGVCKLLNDPLPSQIA